MYSLAALVRPGVGTRTRIAAASPAALGHSPQQHPHSYAAILYKTNTYFISSSHIYCICTIIIHLHSRQDIRFHNFRSKLKKSLKFEPDLSDYNQVIPDCQYRQWVKWRRKWTMFLSAFNLKTLLNESFFSRGIAEVSYPSKHRLKHQGFQTRSENQAPERVSVLDLVKSAAPPNYCPSGQPSPQVTELSLKEMLISFSSSPAHLYLFDRVFDCKIELPATLLWVWKNALFYRTRVRSLAMLVTHWLTD